MTAPRTRNLLRARGAGEHARVEYIELFFDLVFVFAVTQLSHRLLPAPEPVAALETLFLLLAVWWVWMYTTWVTNWLDPQKLPVRFMLFALMALGLVLSAAIPEAFGARALPFALAYAAMQVGRSAFMVWGSGDQLVRARNFLRITIWLGAAGVLWVAGALLPAVLLPLWLAALAIEYAGPWARFAVPILGASPLDSWDVDPHHMAERCALFVIIALGESIILAGASFADLEWTPATIAAFAGAFVGTVAMWWIYFSIGQQVATRRFAAAEQVGPLARLAYTYFHLPIVAGIILSAAGAELVIAHPSGHTETGKALVLIGGAATYLVGNLLFKMAFWRRPPRSHVFGIVVLVLLGAIAASLPPVVLSAAIAVTLIGVAFVEHASLKGEGPAA